MENLYGMRRPLLRKSKVNKKKKKNKNWFERLPLHSRYAYYMIGGIIIGILLTKVF